MSDIDSDASWTDDTPSSKSSSKAAKSKTTVPASASKRLKKKTENQPADIPDKSELLRRKAMATKNELFQSGEARRIERALNKIPEGQPTPRELRVLHGMPIKKKKSTKPRTLLSFPGTISFTSTDGTKPVGSLSRLDTHTPCMYLDFPQGRVKLNGHRQYFNTAISAMNCETNKGLVILDQFDSMIMFSEVLWVGKKESNPDEKALPFPPDIVLCGSLGEVPTEKTETVAPDSAKKIGAVEKASANAERKSRRATVASRKKYVEVNSDDDDIESVSSEDDMSASVWEKAASVKVAVPKEQKTQPSISANPQSAAKAPRTKKRTIASEEELSENSDVECLSQSKPSTTKRIRRSTASKVSYVESNSDKSADEIETTGQTSWSPKAKKRATLTPKASLVAATFLFDSD